MIPGVPVEATALRTTVSLIRSRFYDGPKKRFLSLAARAW